MDSEQTLSFEDTQAKKSVTQQSSSTPSGGKKPEKQAKMSKEKAKSLATRLKRTTLVTSIVAFALFGGLIAPQIQAVVTQSSTTQNATSTSTATQTPAASSSSFFDQSQAGGYSIGSSSSSSSNTSSSNTITTPGTSTHVS